MRTHYFQIQNGQFGPNKNFFRKINSKYYIILQNHTTKSVTDLSFSTSVPAVPNKTTTVRPSGKSVRIKQ